MLMALMEKVENTQDQMEYVNRDMETIIKN